VWIFDLDNTLHDAAARIFPSMHEQINAYLKRHFGVDDAGADAMRRGFWLRYGTTLKGLMRHHGTDPRHFLRETHRFPGLADMVVHEKALRHALARLGGRKLLFSNAPRHYVDQVLRALGVGRFFDAVYSIEDARYLGKPALLPRAAAQPRPRPASLRLCRRCSGEPAHGAPPRHVDRVGQPRPAPRALRGLARGLGDRTPPLGVPPGLGLESAPVGPFPPCPAPKANAGSRS